MLFGAQRAWCAPVYSFSNVPAPEQGPAGLTTDQQNCAWSAAATPNQLSSRSVAGMDWM
jgi:hypothetical protein